MLLLLKPWLRQCVWHRVEHMQRRWSNFYIRASPSHASDTCIHQPHQEGPFLFGDHAVRGGAAWLVPAAEHWCTAPLPVSSHGNLRGAIRCNLAANCCPSSSAHRDAAGCRCLHPFINNGVMQPRLLLACMKWQKPGNQDRHEYYFIYACVHMVFERIFKFREFSILNKANCTTNRFCS